MTTKPKTRKAPAAETANQAGDRREEAFAKAKHEAFLKYEANYEEWLRVRAEGGADETGEQAAERGDREEDLAHFLLTPPLTRRWALFRKFEVIEHILMKHGEVCGYAELMAAEAIANIKLDLLRIGLIREGWK